MSVKEEMAQAKKLIQQKKFEDAQAILIMIDHPVAEKWLDKINKLKGASSGSQQVVVQQDKSFTVKLFISLVLLLFFAIPGVIALAIFAPEARKFPDAPGANALIWLNKITFALLILAGVGAVLFIILPIMFMG